MAIDLASYDHILIGMSGGKDGIASFLTLVELGADPRRIEFHHHDVDGRARRLFDWPITTGYCAALAESFQVPLHLSWREGGLRRELLRDRTPTAPVRFETADGRIETVGGNGPPGTRLRFAQVSADLSVRWCSAVAKIDVMRSLICNSPRFLGARVLVVTGERAEESPSRARYAPFEPHRTDTRAGPRRRRHVDHVRPVHALREAEIWDLLRRHGVVPHVAYQLGFGRVSCMHCIFASANQLATLRLIDPGIFEELARYEAAFGCTIKRNIALHALADRGRPYPATLERPDLVALALSRNWTGPIRLRPEDWTLPAGAFGETNGPT
jgi:3'-phosphoadenosine 5'-phosphosulfate sulfotransferase (PAPS reductase)/FAD synthetase